MPSSSAELKALRERLRAYIAVTPPHNPEFPVLPSELPSADGTWASIVYFANTRGLWTPRQHLLCTQALATRSVLDPDAAARDTARTHALAALAWWVKNDPLCPNWWHNQIGTPRLLAHSLILLGDHVPPDVLAASRPILERAGNFLLTEDGTRIPRDWTGANRLWISANRLLAGALLDDAPLVADALAAALQEIRISPHTEEGIQVDGSFHQHGPLLYNGGYGAAFLTECEFFLAATHHTHWQPDAAYRDLLADFILDGTRWMLRGADFNHGCRDREITRPRQTTAKLIPLVAFLAEAGGPRRAELQDLADALRAGTAPGSLTGNRMFYRADFMAHHTATTHLSVRMHSRRTFRAECCNDEGLQSHHLSDGLTYLMRNGAEYLDLFPVWDWQKLPGITCLQTPLPEPRQTVNHRASTEFVGGVSDGRLGACMQHIRTDTLDARKSWFFGPTGTVVCLGAGIRSSFAGPVVTTLDQSRIQGPVERADRWLRHGPWGFVFPEAVNLTVESGPKTGAWTRIGGSPDTPVTEDVFLAYLNHGDTPQNATYAYVIAPDADTATLARLAATPDFVIVSNTETLQAVWWPAARLLQASFYTDGTLTWAEGRSLQVNRACAVQLHLAADDTAQIDVSEVTQLAEQLVLEYRDATGRLHPASVPLPQGDHLGRTVHV